MVRNLEQNPGEVSERIRKRQKADDIILKMFSLKELPEQRISEKEQQEFGKRIAKGDQRAKEEYILRRLRFAMMAAMDEEDSQPEHSSLTLEDCFQNIIEALQKRLDEYPMNADQDFAEYVGWSVRAAQREGDETSTMVRIPQHVYEKWSKIDKFVKKYVTENDREPSDEEISLATGLSIGQLVQLEKDKWRRDFSNLPLELAADMGDEGAEVFSQVYLNIKKEKLLSFLQLLSYRERKVAELRFGLGGDKPMTQEEVGQLLNVSHTTISRAEKRAIDKLKFLLLNQDTSAYWVD